MKIIKKVPHSCPNCGGTGKERNRDWRIPNQSDEDCHSCNGTGIIFGEETMDFSNKNIKHT
jgi:DnaJ-class molecular chaperone